MVSEPDTESDLEGTFRKTVRIAVPAVLENLASSAIFLVDALMVANLGSAALAAAGLAGVVLWRLRSITGFLQSGTSATVARRWGEGRVSDASDVYTHSAVLGAISGAISLVFLLFPAGLFRLIDTPAAVVPFAVPYFQIILIAMPMRLASVNMAAAIRACGNTRVSMVTTTLINCVNIGGNYLFINGHFGFPALGLFGAGLSTFISFLLEFAIYMSLGFFGVPGGRLIDRHPIPMPVEDEEAEQLPGGTMIRGRREKPTGATLRFGRGGFRVRMPGVTRSILRISFPSFWEEIAIAIGFLGFTGMIARFGEVVTAAHVAVVRIESFSFNVGFGVSIAAAAMVGQALGAKNPAQAWRTFGLCTCIGMTAMGLIGMLFVLHPTWFLQWFASDDKDQFLAVAVPLLILVAIEQPFIGATNVLANGLRGAGMTTAPFLAQFSGVVIVRVGLGWLLAYRLGMGVNGVYIATIADWMTRTAVLGVVVARGKWVNIRV